MLGGWGGWDTPGNTNNEMWKSTDGGAYWTRLADAPWEGRHTAGWLVHEKELWVIGGDVNSGHYQRDVWRGEANFWTGDIDWTLVTDNAEPLIHGRALHQVFSHQGKLWIVGGQTLDELAVNDLSTKPGSPHYDDVWSSIDGKDWTLVSTGNPWAPRGLIMGSPIKDGFMWLVGGGAYGTGSNAYVFSNSVWKSADGKHWEEVTADGGFIPRQYNSVTVFNDELVLIGGVNGRTENLADAYASRDGVEWRRLSTPVWTPRHAHAVAKFRGELLMLGGPLNQSSVWAMR